MSRDGFYERRSVRSSGDDASCWLDLPFMILTIERLLSIIGNTKSVDFEQSWYTCRAGRAPLV
jgi:hypothetical protein